MWARRRTHALRASAALLCPGIAWPEGREAEAADAFYAAVNGKYVYDCAEGLRRAHLFGAMCEGRRELCAWAAGWGAATGNLLHGPLADEAQGVLSAPTCAVLVLQAHAATGGAPAGLLEPAFRWLLELEDLREDRLDGITEAMLPGVAWPADRRPVATHALARARLVKIVYDAEDFGGVCGGMAQACEDAQVSEDFAAVADWVCGWNAGRAAAPARAEPRPLGAEHPPDPAVTLLRAYAEGAAVPEYVLASAFRWLLEAEARASA